MGMLGNANVIGGGNKSLYGLSFDGFNDYLKTAILYTMVGDFSIKITAKLIRKEAYLFAGESGFYYRLISKTDITQERFTLNGVSYSRVNSFIENNQGVVHVFEVTRIGNTLYYKVDGVINDSFTISLDDMQFRFFATDSTFSSFYSVPELHELDIDGVVLNDANNWGGAQVFGATRIKL